MYEKQTFTRLSTASNFKDYFFENKKQHAIKQEVCYIVVVQYDVQLNIFFTTFGLLN